MAETPFSRATSQAASRISRRVAERRSATLSRIGSTNTVQIICRGSLLVKGYGSLKSDVSASAAGIGRRCGPCGHEARAVRVRQLRPSAACRPDVRRTARARHPQSRGANACKRRSTSTPSRLANVCDGRQRGRVSTNVSARAVVRVVVEDDHLSAVRWAGTDKHRPVTRAQRVLRSLRRRVVPLGPHRPAGLRGAPREKKQRGTARDGTPHAGVSSAAVEAILRLTLMSRSSKSGLPPLVGVRPTCSVRSAAIRASRPASIRRDAAPAETRYFQSSSNEYWWLHDLVRAFGQSHCIPTGKPVQGRKHQWLIVDAKGTSIGRSDQP